MRYVLSLLLVVLGTGAAAQVPVYRYGTGQSFTVKAGETWLLDHNASLSDGASAVLRVEADGPMVCNNQSFPSLPLVQPTGVAWPSSGLRCIELVDGASRGGGRVRWGDAAQGIEAVYWVLMVALAFFGYRTGAVDA
jgi:hypothetical protein